MNAVGINSDYLLNTGLRMQLEEWMQSISGSQIVVMAVEYEPVKRLHPDEECFVARAVPGRRAEFAAGRYCAHRALALLGSQDYPIPVGNKGEPVWPEGVVGSITHDRGIAIAALSLVQNLSAIGIDLLQLNHRLEEASAPQIASRLELRKLAHMIECSGIKHNEEKAFINPLLLAFSAKEAAVKLVSPSVDFYLDLRDISLQYYGNRIQANFVNLNRCLTVDWRVINQMLFSFSYEK